ncbi:MAG: hypothetical protein RBT06_07715, partial [Smithellaceae bacterium]|nr:hypothetical protein [Smithellaceae bacterium]
KSRLEAAFMFFVGKRALRYIKITCLLKIDFSPSVVPYIQSKVTSRSFPPWSRQNDSFWCCFKMLFFKCKF